MPVFHKVPEEEFDKTVKEFKNSPVLTDFWKNGTYRTAEDVIFYTDSHDENGTYRGVSLFFSRGQGYTSGRRPQKLQENPTKNFRIRTVSFYHIAEPFSDLETKEVVFDSTRRLNYLNGTDLDSSANIGRTLHVLFTGFEQRQQQNEEAKKQTFAREQTPFEIVHGRPTLPGEGSGFFVKVFKETPTDPGLVLMNGRIFNTEETLKKDPGLEHFFFYGDVSTPRNYSQSLLSRFLVLDHMKNFTRDEFAERLVLCKTTKYGEFLYKNVLAVENFFQEKMGLAEIKLLVEKTKLDYKVFEQLHPKTGIPVLSTQVEGKKHPVYILATKEDSLKKFVGGLIMQKEIADLSR